MQTQTLQEAFDKFHADNPHVYQELVKLARRMKGAGRAKYGINSLSEVLRWHTNLETQGDEFKFNNNLRPFYARLIMEKEADLRGFFEIRERWAA